MISSLSTSASTLRHTASSQALAIARHQSDLAMMRDRMSTALGGPVLQFLGRISYSLYLIHLTVGWRFISVVKLQWGPQLTPLESAVAFLGGIALSVGAAWVMHVTLEAPAMRLARRVPLPRRKTPETGYEASSVN